MKTEDLKKYKKKLSQLSDEEQIERDLYLRQLSTGEILGPSTGYPSIDKPWLKYNSEKAIKTKFEPMSIYQFMEKCSKEYMDKNAINYFGNKITFREMHKKIDETVHALESLGVKKGDIVMMSLPNIPEAEYLFYAINKMGAVINTIDPRTNNDIILETIQESNSKYFFGINVMGEKLKAYKECGMSVISISPYNSLKFPMNKIMSLKEKNNKNYMSWNQFIKNGKNNKSQINSVYEKDKVAAIVHTGGSTGTPKGVMLTNESFNALIYQIKNNELGFKEGETFLNILPPFIALGLDDAMHLSACIGCESIMVPSFEPEQFPKLVMKYKPNYLLCGPIHCNMMYNSEEMKNAELSFLKILVTGGDKYPKEKQLQFQKFLKEHNAEANLLNGYGATETSAGNACTKNNCLIYDSVGAPYLKDIHMVVDENLNELQGTDKVGELLVSGPTLMKGYFGKRSIEMDDVIHKDENGIEWYKTGDLAHFDENGVIFIDGRIKRIITRRGFKIYPLAVENEIRKNSHVKDCAVVGVEDEEEMNIPVANIVLNNEDKNNHEIEEEVINYIDDVVEKNFPEYTVIAGYNFLDELPQTPIGKLDFKKLEKMGIVKEKEKKLQKTYKIM